MIGAEASNGRSLRVAARVAALLTGALLAGYPAVVAGSLGAPAAICGVGFVLVGAAVVGGHRAASGPGLVLLLLGYATSLWTSGGGTDVAAPAVGAGLFVLLELVELVYLVDRTPMRDVVLLRARYASAVALAGLLVSATALLMGDVVSTAEPWTLAIAALSAAAAVGIGVGLARRSVRAD